MTELEVFGTIFRQQRNLEKATRVYQTAAKIAPNNLQVSVKLGLIYINQRQFEPAILAFKQAIAADSTASETQSCFRPIFETRVWVGFPNPYDWPKCSVPREPHSITETKTIHGLDSMIQYLQESRIASLETKTLKNKVHKQSRKEER